MSTQSNNNNNTTMNSTNFDGASQRKNRSSGANKVRKSPDQLCKLFDLDCQFLRSMKKMCYNSLSRLQSSDPCLDRQTSNGASFDRQTSNGASFDRQTSNGASFDRQKTAVLNELKRLRRLERVMQRALLISTAMKDMVVEYVLRRLHKYPQLTRKQESRAEQLDKLYSIEVENLKSVLSKLGGSDGSSGSSRSAGPSSGEFDDLNRFKSRHYTLKFVDVANMTLEEFEASSNTLQGSSYKYMRSGRFVHMTLNYAVKAHNNQARYNSTTYGSERSKEWFAKMVIEKENREDFVDKHVGSDSSRRVLVIGSGLMAFANAQQRRDDSGNNGSQMADK